MLIPLIVALFSLWPLHAGTTSRGLPPLVDCEKSLSGLRDAFPASNFRVARRQNLKYNGRFYMISMSDEYTGEDTVPHHEDGNLVPYLRTPEERAKYRLVFKNNKVYRADGKALYESGNADDLFVMDGQGNVYATYDPSYAHSTFLAGEPVAASGRLRVEKGKLVFVSNASGHYLPPIELIHQFLHHLSSQGIDTSEVKISERRY